MKLFNCLLIAMIIVSSCKEDEVNTPTFDEDYGEGMYIVTDIGISFYNYQDSLPQVTNKIFKKVNNITISNPKKIKFNGTKAYIIADNYILTANVKTFENKEEINGFSNPVDIDFISHDRIFVVDKGDSKVKVVDLTSLDITVQIETGDSTQPVFIVSNSYKSFILNGGEETFNSRDSTIIRIDYRDQLVPLADFNGSLSLAYNPVSAIWEYSPMVLCKGIYNIDDPAEDIESSLYKINGWNNSINSSIVLNGVYNANNLVANDDATLLYFTAHNGVYSIANNSLSYNLILANQASVLQINYEDFYSVTDSALYNVGMLYMNDIENPSTIFKYNLYTSTFQDTIIVDGNVRDINFY